MRTMPNKPQSIFKQRHPPGNDQKALGNQQRRPHPVPTLRNQRMVNAYASFPLGSCRSGNLGAVVTETSLHSGNDARTADS